MATQGLDVCGRPIVNQDNKTLDPETVQSISCIKCCKILRVPHQLSCGDRICQGCLPSGYVACLWEFPYMYTLLVLFM